MWCTDVLRHGVCPNSCDLRRRWFWLPPRRQVSIQFQPRSHAFMTASLGFDSAERMQEHLLKIRELLNVPKDAPLPCGIGFLACVLDADGDVNDPRISLALDHKPPVILFAFGDALGKYVAKVQELVSTREYKTKVYVTVNSVEEALIALNELKVDGMIVQG
jgi:nitronate monooxygenase